MSFTEGQIDFPKDCHAIRVLFLTCHNCFGIFIVLEILEQSSFTGCIPNIEHLEGVLVHPDAPIGGQYISDPAAAMGEGVEGEGGRGAEGAPLTQGPPSLVGVPGRGEGGGTAQARVPAQLLHHRLALRPGPAAGLRLLVHVDKVAPEAVVAGAQDPVLAAPLGLVVGVQAQLP